MAMAAVFLGAFGFSPVRPLYEFDATWKPQFPEGSHTLSGVGISHSFEVPAAGSPPPTSLVYITQRGNTSVAPVLVLNGTTGALIRSWGQDGVAVDKTIPSKPTWGSHGIAVETCYWPCVSKEGELSDHRVYIEDFTGHTVRSYTPKGKLLLSLGTPGVAGNSTSPLQFGNVADAALVTSVVGPGGEKSDTLLYATDGDGGSANRVVKLAITPTGDKAEVKWVTPNNPRRYNNPHSITLHPPSGLLIVADREQQELKLVRSSDGADLGVLDCGLDFGKEGRPFGVRTLQIGSRDLLFVASMDNPQDGKYQRIAVLDAQHITAADGAKSRCSLLQRIQIDPDLYSGPHLLGVDAHNGDLYAALVADAPLSTVLRYKCTGC